MSEHDEAGSAVTLPPLPPPPPPQPAASRASAATAASNAASESLLLTLPPRSPSEFAARRVAAAGQVSGLAAGLATAKRRYSPFPAEVAELADAPDSKSGSLRGVWVRFPPSALPAPSAY